MKFLKGCDPHYHEAYILIMILAEITTIGLHDLKARVIVLLVFSSFCHCSNWRSSFDMSSKKGTEECLLPGNLIVSHELYNTSHSHLSSEFSAFFSAELFALFVRVIDRYVLNLPE